MGDLWDQAAAQLQQPSAPAGDPWDQAAAQLTAGKPTPEQLAQAQKMAQAANPWAGQPAPEHSFLENVGRGVVGSFAPVASGLEEAGALGAHAVGWNAGEGAMLRAAGRTNAYQADSGSVGGQFGGFIGGAANLAVPVFAGASAALGAGEQAEALHNSGQLSNGQEAAFIGGQGLLNYGLARLGQANVTGDLLERVLPQGANLATRLGATAATEGALNVAGQVASNQLTKSTGVNPNQDMLEGVLPAAGIGAVVGGGLRGAREALGSARGEAQWDQAQAQVQPTEEPDFTKATFTDIHGNPAPIPESAAADTARELKERQTAKEQEPPSPDTRAPVGPEAEADQDTLDRIKRGMAQPDENPQRRTGERNFTPDEDRALIQNALADPNAFGRRAGDWQQLSQEGKTLLQKLREQQIAKEQDGRESNTLSDLRGEQAAKEEGTLPPAEPKRPAPNAEVQAHAEGYAKQAGLDYNPDTTYAKVDPERAQRIAADYDAMKHDPEDPKVKASYDAFKRETLNQYNYLKDQGVTFDHVTENPYADSKAMAKDVSENKHLSVYSGGDMPADHPLAEKLPGRDLTYNDAFRAVHDYFGHAKEGYGFGPRGEENAWRQHSQMYSPEARGAMTAETRGQNSWVNFGPHGEANRANPKNTMYAEQKAGLLPDEHTQLDEPRKLKATARAGASPIPNMVANQIERLYTKDIKPAVTEAATTVGDAYQALKSGFGQQTGAAADTGRAILRNRGAELQRRLDQLHHGLDSAITAADALSKSDQHAITDAWEAGKDSPVTALQPAIDTIQDLQDEAWKEISRLGPEHQLGYIDNYYRHQYKDPVKAQSQIAEALAKRPMQGNTGYRKARSIMTMADARAAGLEAADDNPIRTGLNALQNMNKYITAHQAAGEMSASGLLKDIPQNGRIPDAWAKINDSVFKKKMAPQEVADLVNNLLDPGLTGSDRTGPLARKVLGAGNTVNMFQLGLNLFHAAKTSFEAWKSAGAQGTRELLNIPEQVKQGNLAGVGKSVTGAAKNYALAATGVGPVIKDFLEGSKIKQEWLKPGSTDPQTAALVNTMKEAGHRATGERDYIPGYVDSFKKALAEKSLLGAAWRAPLAGLEKLSEPIMKTLVPNVKNGVLADMVRSEMSNLKPGASVDQIRQTIGKAVDSVDNRFGLMTNDNLFWNKSLRQIGQLLTRSLPYQVGTIREYGGAATDVARALGQAVRGNGEATKSIQSNRVAYALTSPVMAALAGGLTTYAMTGRRPQKALDYLMPDTGRKDKDGEPIRLKLPNYENDLMEFTSDPIKTIKAKMSGLVGVVAGLAANQDYRRVEIANPADSFLQRAGERAAWTAKQFEPISVQNLRKMMNGGAGAGAALPFVGISEAPRGMDQSAAEQTAHELIQRKNTAPRTAEEADRSDQVSRLATEVRQHSDTAFKDIDKAVATGAISFVDRKKIFQQAQEPTGLLGAVKSRELDADDLMRVWDAATPDERRQIQWTMRKRILGSDKDFEEKRAYISRINDDVKESK